MNDTETGQSAAPDAAARAAAASLPTEALDLSGLQPMTRRQRREMERAAEAAAARTGSVPTTPANDDALGWLAPPQDPASVEDPTEVPGPDVVAEVASDAISPADDAPEPDAEPAASVEPDDPTESTEHESPATDDVASGEPEGFDEAVGDEPVAAESSPEVVASSADGVVDAVADESVADDEPADIAQQAEEAAAAASVEAERADVPSAPATSAWAPESAPDWSAPQGHWTQQLAAIESDDESETTFSRSVGSAAPATNALLLTDIPSAASLNATGEFVFTGAVDLPSALAETGAHEQIERDGIDSLLDEFDPGEITDVKPVPAVAVSSTHALGSPVVNAVAPRANRTLTVLLIVASALAVVVTGLVVAAFVFGAF